jgi:hypothetical protein
MKTIARTAFVLGLVSLAGCATSNEMGWHHPGHDATEVQVASCDAATATLTGQHDHDLANRACRDAKVRQGVD